MEFFLAIGFGCFGLAVVAFAGWLVSKKVVPPTVFAVLVFGLVVVTWLGSAGERHYILDVEGLNEAASNGDVARVKQLLASGADPNEADDNESYPLQGAVINNHPEVVRILLHHGANPNIGGGPGMPSSLLRCAISGKDAQIVKMLKAAGAKP